MKISAWLAVKLQSRSTYYLFVITFQHFKLWLFAVAPPSGLLAHKEDRFLHKRADFPVGKKTNNNIWQPQEVWQHCCPVPNQIIQKSAIFCFWQPIMTPAIRFELFLCLPVSSLRNGLKHVVTHSQKLNKWNPEMHISAPPMYSRCYLCGLVWKCPSDSWKYSINECTGAAGPLLQWSSGQ